MKFDVYLNNDNNNNNNADNKNNDQTENTILSVTRKFKIKLWYHLTITLSPKTIDAGVPTLRLYINGQLTDKGVASTSRENGPLKSSSSSSAIYLGSPIYDKDGKLMTSGGAIATSYDNIAMWHRALNDDQVRTNFETILGKPLILYLLKVQDESVTGAVDSV